MSLADQQWCPTSVQVTVLQARGLRTKGKSGTNDAYAVMQVGKEKYQTSVVEKCVAPAWKEQAAFDLPPPLHQSGGGGGGGGGGERGTLHVHVLHRALMGPDKQLGQAVINLLQLSEDKTRNKTEWFKLLDKTGKADKDRGEVLLDIQFMRNNMTASMFDLSAAGKSRSRLGKFKDKVRGKKKESDAVSSVVPSFTQVLTDSEEEADRDGDVAAGKDEKKKKQKIKSLFSPKSNLQKNMSQSMSVLPPKNSSPSGSQSSGLNVDSSEGKKKFKFMKHKRSGSSDSKDSSSGHQRHGAVEQSNLCINGSHVYCEEPQLRTSRIGSNFSLASSGHGSMEDVPESSPPSVDSLRAMRQYSPWTEEDEEMAEVENITEDVDEPRREEEERVRMEGEEGEGRSKEEARVRRQEEFERLAEEKRRKEEEERRKIEDEERRRQEEEERRKIEDEERKRQEDKEMVRRQEEEHKLAQEKIRLEEERTRKEKVRKEEEENIRKEKAEEERRRKEEAERMRRQEEERKLAEEKRRLEEEKVRKEEEERLRREEQRAEEERRRKEEEERMRRQEEECKLADEKRRLEEERRIEEEKVRKEEEERIMREEERRRKEEEERIRLEECKLAEEKRRLEDERRVEEEKVRKEEEERIIREEERRRKEEEERIRLEEERKLAEEKKRLEEERAEEERRRMEEEERIMREEERRQRDEEERIRREEERRQEEEERARKEKEEYERLLEEKRKLEEERRQEEKARKEKEEYERLLEEKRKLEEERRQEEEDRARKENEEYERLLEEKRKLEEKEKELIEAEEKIRMEEETRRKNEEAERVRREEEEREEKRRLEQRRIEEEERIRKEKQDKIKKEKEEYERLVEEKRRLEEQEKRQKEEEERIRKEEQERIRIEEECRRRQEEERAKKEKEEMERLAEEKRRIEEEKIKKQEEEKIWRVEKAEREKKEEEARRLENEKLTREAEEQKRQNETQDGHKAERQKSEVIVASPAEVTSTNPFDENFSYNPFEEIPSSPAGPESSTAKVSSVQQGCQSATSLVGSKPVPTDIKDLISAQREKRPAPQPPGRKRTSHCEPDAPTRHVAEVNKQNNDKDVKTVSVLPQRSVQMIAPLSQSPTDTKIQSRTTKATASVAKHSKRPAPSRPRSVEEGPSFVPRTASSSDGTIFRGHSSETKQVPVVYGLNPFEDDDYELTAQDDTTIPDNTGSIQWPLAVSQAADKNTASQAKHKSSKVAHAPPPPAKKAAMSSTLVHQIPEEDNVTDDPDVAVLDNGANKACDPPPEAKISVPVKDTSIKEAQPARAKSSAEEAGVTKDVPTTNSRRLHPVKPLNPLEQQSVPIVQSEKSIKSTGILNEVQEKTKVNNAERLQGPYSQLTRQELISLVLKQENQLSEKDKKISELEQYIDNLLVRVIEEKPSILMFMNSLKKDI